MLELCVAEQNRLMAVVEARGCVQGGFVWGEGPRGAAVAFVGEAPGGKEVAEGRPFVGQAGEHLNSFLGLAGIQRSQIYVTNAVKFRPVKQGRRGFVNRPPTIREIRLCQEYLLEELGLLDQLRLIVSLGNVPLRALTQAALTIGQIHGQLISWYGPRGQVQLFPLYHPASIIYNKKLSEIYQGDLLKLAKIIAPGW